MSNSVLVRNESVTTVSIWTLKFPSGTISRLFKTSDIADEVRDVLHRAKGALRAEEVLNQLASRERLIAQGGAGSAGYFAAVELVRQTLAHVGAAVTFTPMDVDRVTGGKAATITSTRRLVPVYRLTS